MTKICQSHSGSNEGFFSQMMRVPEENLVISVLGNVESTDALDHSVDELLRLARGLPYQAVAAK